MPGRVAWTKYKKKRPNETKEEREARIAREKRKAKHAKEVSAVVPSRVSYVKKPFAENSLFSIGLAAAALAFLALGLAGSVRTQGQGALNVGAFGLCSLLVLSLIHISPTCTTSASARMGRYSGLRRWSFDEYESESGRCGTEESGDDSFRDLRLRGGIQ